MNGRLFLASLFNPTIAIAGVGNTETPFVSLYRDTFPLTTGVFNLSQASFIPSQDFANCHITSGFSGFPKFRQSVIARG